MKNTGWIVALAVIGLTLGACGETSKPLHGTSAAPTAAPSYAQSPLSLPPGFGDRPNAAGKAEIRKPARSRSGWRAKAQPVAPVVPGASAGVQALLLATQAHEATPEIRAVINRETSLLAEENAKTTERILFWRIPANRASAGVDGEPIISRGGPSVLDRIYNIF